MKDVLTFILKNITTLPEDVTIEEKEEDGGTNYLISVNPTDVGRIIGKEGKIIKAIRTIMRVIAIQKGVRVRVSVLSENNNDPTAPQTPEELSPETTSESMSNPSESEPTTDSTPEKPKTEETTSQSNDDIIVEV